jgi:hypothetical protein
VNVIENYQDGSTSPPGNAIRFLGVDEPESRDRIKNRKKYLQIRILLSWSIG